MSARATAATLLEAAQTDKQPWTTSLPPFYEAYKRGGRPLPDHTYRWKVLSKPSYVGAQDKPTPVNHASHPLPGGAQCPNQNSHPWQHTLHHQWAAAWNDSKLTSGLLMWRAFVAVRLIFVALAVWCDCWQHQQIAIVAAKRRGLLGWSTALLAFLDELVWNRWHTMDRHHLLRTC